MIRLCDAINIRDNQCCHALLCLLQESLVKLFLDAGFRCEEYKVHERQIENRQQEVTIHRRWVQAVFTYAPQQADAGLQTSSAAAQAAVEVSTSTAPDQVVVMGTYTAVPLAMAAAVHTLQCCQTSCSHPSCWTALRLITTMQYLVL